MNNLQFTPILHKGQTRIQVSFEKNETWNQRIKKVPGAKWSRTLRSWHIPDTEENRRKCGLPLKDLSVIQPKHAQEINKTALLYLSENNKEQMRLYLQQLQLKAYSLSTIRTYRNEFAQLLQLLGKIAVQDLQPHHLQRYLIYCMEHGLKENTVHSRMNALKFYFEQVLHKEKMFTPLD